jgi:hypothetical protein
MIRGTIPSAFFLVFCLAAAPAPRAALAVPQEDIPRAAPHQGEAVYDTDGGVSSGMIVRHNPVRGVAVAAKPEKTERKGQKFIDEDGDGYNDRRPETAPAKSAVSPNAGPAQSKNKGKSESNAEDAVNPGFRKGQTSSPGPGIGGALERGIKRGQGSSRNSLGATDNGNAGSNVRNNGKNRFGRNFEKYDRSSREK